MTIIKRLLDINKRSICDALRNLVPFVQFNTDFTIQFTLTLLKVTLLYGCFSRFLNGQNGIKSRKASYIDRCFVF